MPHIKAAVCVRGTPAAMAWFCSEITKAGSYDGLKASISSRVRAIMDEIKPSLNKLGPYSFLADIFVAGWSEQNGPDAYVLATTDLNLSAGRPAFKVVPLSGCIVPGTPELEKEFASMYANFDEVRVIELARRQREVLVQLPWDPENQQSGVGGFVQLTTVRRKSIETKVLKHWPDFANDRIHPIAA